MQPESREDSYLQRKQTPASLGRIIFCWTPQLFMTMMLVLYEAIIAIQVALAEAKGRSGR